MTKLILTTTHTATTYSFRAEPGQFGWACCTVNDDTGELLITSDWGSWSHRWSADPRHLGAPTLTAFIGGRSGVDYLARKLQNEGTNGRRWSAEATAAALRRRLCERRLEDGRAQIENRLEPEDMPDGKPLRHLVEPIGRYTADGLPIYSDRMPAEYRNGRPWKINGELYESLPYLTRDAARQLWDAIGELANEVGGSADLFYDRVWQIDGFTDYVTRELFEYGETEQTPEDKALRELVLPALIEACRARVAAEATPATAAGSPAAARSCADPVCATCNDTHLMTLGDRDVMCTRCPVPCSRCRSKPQGAYCATTPCACSCHAAAAREQPAREPVARQPSCTNNSPPGLTARWQDWHRGHGCDKDDGKPRTPAGQAEIAVRGVQ